MKGKKIFISFIIFVLLTSISTFCFADINVDDFNAKADAKLLGDAIDFSTILGIIQWIGIAVAVAYLILMGIKFTLGSVDDKAEIKKHMVPYFIGLIIIVCITSIANAIAGLASKI